jgi:hypothetical protein
MADPEQLKAEAKELYAQARAIEDETARLSIVIRALELEMAAETCVLEHQTDAGRRDA